MTPNTKLCRHCGEVKERADFYPHNRDGVRAMCRDCQRAWQRAQIVVAIRHRDEVRAEFLRLLGADEAVAS